MSVELYSANSAELVTIAGFLSRLDACARIGAVVALRVDYGRASGAPDVYVGVGDAYLHAEGGELQPLLEEAMVFIEGLRAAPWVSICND